MKMNKVKIIRSIIDGSDNMADYLKVSASIDSIYKVNK